MLCDSHICILLLLTCCCISGAGNQLPVVALDILHMLFAEDQVVLAKMNPVNDYYGPLLRQVKGGGGTACFALVKACLAHDWQ
jgi:hypothetical protein